MRSSGILLLTIVIFLSSLSSPVSADENIQIKGWRPMVPIIQDAVKDFENTHPNIAFTVSEEENLQALRELDNGTIDIALSRDITDFQGQDATIDYSQLFRYTIGKTAVVIIINNKNPVASLSLEQLQHIYKGDISNWREVGGEDTSILTVGYSGKGLFTKSSGIRSLFFKKVMFMDDSQLHAAIEVGADSNQELFKIVSENPNAIAYTYFKEIDPTVGDIQYSMKTLAIQFNENPVAPTVRSVNDGSYTIFENLNIYTKGEASGVINEFIDYLMSPSGQSHVTNHGQVPILYNQGIIQEVKGPITITSPGYYWLSNDIIDPTDSIKLSNNLTVIINIQSHDVIFDGRGHTISGRKSKYSTAVGIGDAYKTNRSPPMTYIRNFTIQNLTITNSYLGISGFRTVDGKITNVVTLNNDWSIRFEGAKNISITNNTMDKNHNGIFCQDLELMTIRDNFIDHCYYGITLWGKIRTGLPDFKDVNRWIGVLLGTYKLGYVEKFSGENNLISSNRISNAESGIELYEVDHSLISNNKVVDGGYGITNINIGANNTFSDNILLNNRENTRDSTYRPPVVMVIFSILLIFLQSGFGITKEFVGEQIVSRLRWVEDIASKLPSKIKYIGDLPIIHIFYNPFVICVIGIAVIALPYQYSYISRIEISTITIFAFIGGLVIVIRESIRYILAKKFAMSVAFRLWWFGIFLTLATGFIFKSVFGQPLKTVIKDQEKYSLKEVAYISLSGPLSFFILFPGFFFCYLQQGLVSYFGKIGCDTSLVITLVSFLPVAPLDGKGVLKWKKWIWVVIFILLLAVYCYFIYHTQILPLFDTIY